MKHPTNIYHLKNCAYILMLLILWTIQNDQFNIWQIKKFLIHLKKIIISRDFNENIHERVNIIKKRIQRAYFHKKYIDYIQNEVTLEMGVWNMFMWSRCIKLLNFRKNYINQELYIVYRYTLSIFYIVNMNMNIFYIPIAVNLKAKKHLKNCWNISGRKKLYLCNWIK